MVEVEGRKVTAHLHDPGRLQEFTIPVRRCCSGPPTGGKDRPLAHCLPARWGVGPH
ncbi:hypothetical protein [Thermogymnomonas acidicola]|uniref:hypothetical protein n=1 Tax=Thermogymnomonas acidicola TaxID=399579 RepID=UPI00149487DF|nr:hypothetical protein [Thermogymnomonas acidicola]